MPPLYWVIRLWVFGFGVFGLLQRVTGFSFSTSSRVVEPAAPILDFAVSALTGLALVSCIIPNRWLLRTPIWHIRVAIFAASLIWSLVKLAPAVPRVHPEMMSLFVVSAALLLSSKVFALIALVWRRTALQPSQVAIQEAAQQ